MPTISRFYGITITMYYDDHNPPHFHARYGGSDAYYSIYPLAHIGGKIPKRAERLVLEWAKIHQAELIEDWEEVMAEMKPSRIEPLQ